MSRGMQYPVQILSAVCMPRCCTCLIPAQTMPRLSCRWICPLYSLNITSDSTVFSRRRTRIVSFLFVFVFLPFLHTLKPETSVADKHNDCTPVSSAPEGSRGCLLAHARHAEKRANDTTGQMVILHCVRSGKGGFLCSLFDTEGCRGRRVDVCEIHRTAASLAQWSVKLSPSSTRTPSYTFLSPLLRAVHAGLLSTALSQWSTLVITMTGTATPWQAA